MKSIFLILAVVFTLLVPHLNLSYAGQTYNVKQDEDCVDGYTKGGRGRERGRVCYKISELKEMYPVLSADDDLKCAKGYARMLFRSERWCVEFSEFKNDIYNSGSEKAECAPGYVKEKGDRCFKIAVTNKYTIKSKKNCHVDYAEGQIQGNKKECLKISTLGNQYGVRFKDKCNSGYVKGVNVCLKIKVTDKYTVLVNEKCGVDYAEGLIQGYKECLKIAKLKDKYKTHPKGNCVFDYIEGQIQTNEKECLKISKLKNEYKVHSSVNKCAPDYVRIIKNNNKNHKDYCRRK